LLRGGLSAEAVFVELRGKYDRDVPDSEIRQVISWAESKVRSRSGAGERPYRRTSSAARPCPARHVTAEDALASALRWLGGFACEEVDLWEASPWRPLEDWRLDALMLFAGLYGPNDLINIVAECCAHHPKEGEAKWKPIGAGATKTRDDWMRWIRSRGVPECQAGAWVRPNPVRVGGSGKNGAFTDRDVVAHRFLVIESDMLPLDVQLSVLARVALPIAAIIHSGSRSYHGWVQLDAHDATEFARQARQIMGRLQNLGFDPANTNPSRMSRLPGACRHDLPSGTANQRLIYLNPDPRPQPIIG